MDVHSLLQPISPEKPCGEDMRSEPLASLYYEIRNARLEARTIEKNDLSASQWGQAKDFWQHVYSLSLEALTTHSKDLQIASWLIEALVRLESFKGLADGLSLARQLIDRYWDHLYPLPSPDDDESDLDSRLASFAGLNGWDSEGTLIFPILNTLVTHSKSVPSYTTWQYQRALDLERITDPTKKQEKIEGGAVSLEAFTLSVKETDPSFFQELVEDLQLALKELKELDKNFSQKTPNQAPSLTDIKQALTACLDGILSFARDYLPTSVSSLNPDEEAVPGNLNNNPAENIFSDREESLQALLKIADFFAKSEPHSPLPYLIKKAVRWGKTPLPDLLEELVEDQGSLTTIFRLVGMEARQ